VLFLDDQKSFPASCNAPDASSQIAKGGANSMSPLVTGYVDGSPKGVSSLRLIKIVFFRLTLLGDQRLGFRVLA
jgi:hypothetical protein